jgi:allophanate hydrolase subunit 1
MNATVAYYVITGVAALVGAVLGLRSYISKSKAAWELRVKQDQEHVIALKECTKAISALTVRLDYTSTTLANYGERITRLEWQSELSQNRPTRTQHQPPETPNAS